MCGIIGYVGLGKASQIITDGLKRLEYRGYDSVGIAVLKNKKFELRKDKGMVGEVSSQLEFTTMDGNIGIGHTRWATHGVVCTENAHPHFDCNKTVVLAHNGVIENFLQLKKGLNGHKFSSETDSEVVAHIFEENLKLLSPEEAFLTTISSLGGSYAIAALSTNDPEERLFIARRNSPLIIGVGKGEMFCASDIPAMLPYTRSFIHLEEGDRAILSKSGYTIYDPEGKKINREIITVDWNFDVAQKGGYSHFMLKEIHDQEHFIGQTLHSETDKAKVMIDKFEKIHILAAGTSYHSALLFSYLLSEKGKIAQAFVASDYQFIGKPDEKTLVIAISQSGETADVLQALRYASKSKKIAITNTIGSTITRISDETILLNAGPEVGVAATKTFTSQMAIIYKIIYGKVKLSALQKLIATMLECEESVRKIAPLLAKKSNVFFIARGKNVPIAYEASLKFKEITYISSEAYPGGELKHGTLSLITEGVPVIVLAPNDQTLSKLAGNIQEAKARGAMILSITDDPETAKISYQSIQIPKCDPLLYPFALIIPLQLLAYHVSIERGINPDRPRNLAKSVTVE